MFVKGTLLCLLNIAPLFLRAQTFSDEVTYVQTIWGAEKRQLVTDYMKLQNYEASAFWKVYDRYEQSRKELARKKIMLIRDYAESYKSLTEGKADEIAKKIMANNLNYEKLNREYYNKFKKATSATKAIQFFQLESYITSTISTYLQDNTPLIADLEKAKR